MSTENLTATEEPSFVLDAIAELERIERQEKEKQERDEFQADFAFIRVAGAQVLNTLHAETPKPGIGRPGYTVAWPGIGVEHRLLESMSPEALRAVLGEWIVEIPVWSEL